MEEYINKSALVEEIDRQKIGYNVDGKHSVEYDTTRKILNIIDTLEMKDVEELASVAYVVTRCEEHSDYVEKVFFDENKAHEYRDQFKGNDNEYARHITKVKVTL